MTTTTAVETPVGCDQQVHALRFDWGLEGLHALAPTSTVLVIVDVLRFSSAVSAAVERGARVAPARWQADVGPIDEDVIVAGRREDGQLSLSPTDLLARVPAGVTLVLPSPNGATLAAAATDVGAPHILAGCLRNARATARRARALAGPDGSIAVVAAGERWGDPHGPLRPAVEDLLGAGAILLALDPAAALRPPACSPEAAAARAAFAAARSLLADAVAASTSGRELVARGWADDVAACAELDRTDLAAELVDGRFVGV